ncbi:DUF1648 domain-containing protein [Sporosarcina sp. BI001-red]|uniref:DUF1648 domain-containing protein n=1 Tax=Sporosarcina sp. BI001-red TaxID=2282866 RepID=UPI000E2291F0|nr:DUF1648 domain-containing protein [Sporosarcina sp. BI001-red]REB08669.1 DUF1648 domain-containing protein [Sporosarcina sp. BI001-red]
MQKPPKHVETHKTRIGQACDVIGILLFLAIIFYTVFQWNRLPEEVPIHFNAAGEVDNYGSKWALLLVPLISVGLFALLEFLERHPEWHNYPKRLNEVNAPRFYQSSRELLNRVKNLSLLLMTYTQWEIVRVGLGDLDAMSEWGFGGILALMLIVIYMGVAKQRKIK